MKGWDKSDDDLLGAEKRDLVQKHVTKISGILEILRRDRMKVVFFGR